MAKVCKLLTCGLFCAVFASSFCFAQPGFIEHTVAGNYNSPWCVQGIDLDSDGDTDIVGSAFLGGSIDWWENDGNQNFTRHSISNNASGAMAFHVIDLDLDGDQDVVCALNTGASVSWYENLGAQDFIRHTIGNWQGSNFSYATDVDLDGDIDVLATACEYSLSRNGWFENDGSQLFTEHILHDDWTRANSIYAADVDSDSDIDILGTASISSIICWFENDGFCNFSDNIISQGWGRLSSIYAEDLDRDDDMDLLTTACIVDQIGWWENDGSGGFTYHTIGQNFYRPHMVRTGDLDNDGDIDVLGAAINGDEISWWENNGQSVFTKHVIVDDFDGATGIHIADVDNDGDLDVLGTAQFGNEIAWFENQLYTYAFEADPTTGHAPLNVQFTDLSVSIGPINGWAWDFENDGEFDSFEQDPNWTYDVSGIYNVRLCLYFNDILIHTVAYENYITVFDGFSALEFDGEESYGRVMASTSLNLTDQFTVEAWINPYDWGENTSMGLGRIIDKVSLAIFLFRSGAAINDHSLVIYHIDSEYNNGFTFTPENSISLFEWQHAAITYNIADGFSIYLDGLEQDLTQVDPPVGGINDNLYDDLYIGNSEGSPETFDGIIDELRVWDYSRSQTEIQANMNTRLNGGEPGLLAYWPMEEGNGDTIFDNTGNGYDAGVFETGWTWGRILYPTEIIEDNSLNLPLGMLESVAYPNPFNHSTQISYRLEKRSEVAIEIYDLLGRKLETLFQGEMTAGSHQITWNASGLSSGIYFYKVNAGDLKEIKKIMLLK